MMPNVFLVAAGLVGLVWLVRLLAAGRTLGRREVLTAESYQGPPVPSPRVSILVAARDEEDCIETCVTTLLAQDYPNFELIVANDRSSDRTPEILGRLERQAEGRLRVIHIQSVRSGWPGKNNAMREAVAAATGDWYLFTDADCRQTSLRTIGLAVSEANAHDVDFLSITPVLAAPTVWERIIQPACVLVLMINFLPRRVNCSRGKTAYANGAFMLVRRDCYEAIGGHEAVRDRLNEDVHLARLTKEAGRRLRVVENDGLYQTRMYRTLPGLWRGWSRIFAGCLDSPVRIGVWATLVLLNSVGPWVALLASLLGWSIEAVAPWAFAVAAWSMVVVLEQAVIWLVYPRLRVGRWWSLTYLLGACVVFGMLVRALLQSTGILGTTWRGRTYRRGRRGGETGSMSVAAQPVAQSIEEPTGHA